MSSDFVWETASIPRAAINSKGCIEFRLPSAWKKELLPYKFDTAYGYQSSELKELGEGGYAQVFRVTRVDPEGKREVVAMRRTTNKKDFKSTFATNALIQVLLQDQRISPAFLSLSDAFRTAAWPDLFTWPYVPERAPVAAATPPPPPLVAAAADIYCTVSSLASEGSLVNLLNGRDLKFAEEKLPLLFQLFQAAAALRSIGLAHHDVKPDNMLVDRLSSPTALLWEEAAPGVERWFFRVDTNLRLYVTDFGLSQQYLVAAGESFTLGTNCSDGVGVARGETRGTKEYIAPEMQLLEGSGLFASSGPKSREDIRSILGSDVYSAAVSACELAAGAMIDDVWFSLSSEFKRSLEDLRNSYAPGDTYTRKIYKNLTEQGLLFGTPSRFTLQRLFRNYLFPAGVLEGEFYATPLERNALAGRKNADNLKFIQEVFRSYRRRLADLLTQTNLAEADAATLAVLATEFPWSEAVHAQRTTEILRQLEVVAAQLRDPAGTTAFFITAAAAAAMDNPRETAETAAAVVSSSVKRSEYMVRIATLYQTLMDVTNTFRTLLLERVAPLESAENAFPALGILGGYLTRLEAFNRRFGKGSFLIYMREKSVLVDALVAFFDAYVTWPDREKSAVDPAHQGIFMTTLYDDLDEQGVDVGTRNQVRDLCRSALDWDFEARPSPAQLLRHPLFARYRISEAELRAQGGVVWTYADDVVLRRRRRRTGGDEQKRPRGEEESEGDAGKKTRIASSLRSAVAAAAATSPPLFCALPGCRERAVHRCSQYPHRTFCAPRCAERFWMLYSNKTMTL
jgi:serine/threonine protein kinase